LLIFFNLHFLLLHQLILLLHRNFLLQGILHFLYDIIGLRFIAAHNFVDHFAIDHHLVHFVIEDLHALGHFGGIEVVHLLVYGLGEVGEVFH
jgi:hypothetical protein